MNSIGKQFMEQTKYQYLGESDQDRDLPQPPLELDDELNVLLGLDGKEQFTVYLATVGKL